MSVYTRVGRDDLAAWLIPLQLGELVDHAGIAAGVQNSNYFVTTTTGRFVLTVFEVIAPAQLDGYLGLMAHLAERGLPCPQPLTDAAGRHWRPLAGKPAALLTCLPGATAEAPSVGQCRTIGGLLARLHRAAADFPGLPPNPRGALWRAATGKMLLPALSTADAALLADELAFQTAQDASALPAGPVHGDLFRDNVLWTPGECLSGVLDFYFAGVDVWLFDLAVVANDWCATPAHLAALVAGYEAERPLTPAEREAWPAQRRAAALRFWLSRLEAHHRPRAGEVVTVKDPLHFRHLLEHLRLAPAALPL